MKQPPSIQPASRPGPDYDPMDQIVQDLENIESFVSCLALNPKDLKYLNSHLPGILALRRTLSHQLDKLVEDPYNYPPSPLKTLHQENEKLFLYLEGAVGAMNPWNEKEFKKMVKAVETILSTFDDFLTP